MIESAPKSLSSLIFNFFTSSRVLGTKRKRVENQ
jgi:hypothetical protein